LAIHAGLQRRDGSKIGKEVADIEALGLVDQLRIAELAADRLTNREIAQPLFVTVEPSRDISPTCSTSSASRIAPGSRPP
jgi:hypothetical protein